MTPLQALLEEHPLGAPDGPKDARGSVVVAGGPEACPGAVLLAAEAALRTGAGRVQLAVHPAVAPHVAVAAPECLVLPWQPEGEPSPEVCRAVGDADVLVVGPGYSDDLASAAQVLARGVSDGHLVLDAGALGAVGDIATDASLVIAPNADEAAELAGADGPEDELARRLADRLGRPLAVRGAATVVSDGRGGLWCYESASSGLGTPGSGDVLIGTLAGLLARGLPPVAALAWSVALHGQTGELVERTTPVGYLARDLVARLPAAFVELGAT